MFDFVPLEFRPFVGVGGLAVLFLAVASMIQRYRQWQAEKLARAQRLLRGAAALERTLQRLYAQPVPRELLALAKDELLLRFRRVKELFADYEGIDERIHNAERLRSDHGVNNWDPPQFDDTKQLDAYHRGLTAMVDFLSAETLESDIGGADLRELRERIRTLRAEVLSGHFTRACIQAAREADWHTAQERILRLLSLLKAKAPPNDRGKALYQEALALYREISQHRLPADHAA